MKFSFRRLYTTHPWAATALVLAAMGGAGFVTAAMISHKEVAEAEFVCPADTECPYSSSGEFVGFKNAWPAGCIYLVPGGTSKPEKNIYNPTDRRASTTAPLCRPGPVAAYRFPYYERGHKMRNVGAALSNDGCVRKFSADGSSLGVECFPTAGSAAATTGTTITPPPATTTTPTTTGTVTTTPQTTVVNTGIGTTTLPSGYNSGEVVADAQGNLYVLTPRGTKYAFTNWQDIARYGYTARDVRMVDAAVLNAIPTTTDLPLLSNVSFRYPNVSQVYYLAKDYCKEVYVSGNTLSAWGVREQDILTVPASVQYPDCALPYVRLPYNTVVWNGSQYHLIRGSTRHMLGSNPTAFPSYVNMSNTIVIPPEELSRYTLGATLQ